METFEDLGAAIGTVSHDSEALIQRAVLDGRSRQRRRRLGAGVGAVAAGAVLVGSLLLSGGSQKGDGTAVAEQPSPTVEPSGGGQSSPAADGPVALPSPELTDARLAAGLPVPGTPVSATGNHDYVMIVRTIDPDGSGAASVSLALESAPPLSTAQISGGDQKCQLLSQSTGTESCKALANGWMFTYASHPDLQGASPRALDWGATVDYQDGTSVSLHVTNYVDGADPTRPTPPLDLDQIEALAHDPVWFQPAS